MASRDHARRGVAEGVVQANYGKPGPVRRMQPGNGLLLYASKLVFGQAAPCQCVVALGEVSEGAVFQTVVSADFQPFRRRVRSQPVTETPIQPLLEHLAFSKDKAHWGYSFRLGCFQIPAADFHLVRAALAPTPLPSSG